MQKPFAKHKFLIVGLILVGVVSFSVCHASVMAQSMDGMDCQAQTFCAACPVPVTSDSPDLSSVLTQICVVLEKPSCLPVPHNDPFYHPPR